MILNSESVELIRANAHRLAQTIRSKDDLVDLATASSFEQVFSAIETILTNTEMYFDDNLLIQLDVQTWQSFKAVLLVYTLNVVNRQINIARENEFNQQAGRDFGASSTNI
ncbi:hypothetical protein [Fluviispira multicolorata]|uniref:Uncharacterized protein n=1 Tax=Fluviispira multicolorata TaxID=2654512 RepID=A0A833JDH6_9BACT|nr:hypothetical protein [Fluviispira multicolorata]KAB8031923.1 hypothetical protein GCL57_04565 [Fluviispira multicolorata]